MGDLSPASGLGSLGQSARKHTLKSARSILIGVGILTMLANGALFFFAESLIQSQIDAEIKKAGPGLIVDRAKLNSEKDKLVRAAQLMAAGTAALGVVFIILGIAIYLAPVVCTVTGLCLYLGATVVFFVLDPESFKQAGAGLFIKVLIIIGLAKAVQTAAAYQKEQQAIEGADA